MYPAQMNSPETVMLVSQGQITAVLLLDSSTTSSCLPAFPAPRRGLFLLDCLCLFFCFCFFFLFFFFSEGFSFLFEFNLLPLVCFPADKAGSSLGLLLDLRPQTTESR